MQSIFSWMLALSIFAVGFASAVDALAAPRSQYDEEFSKLDRNGDKRLTEQEYVGKKTGGAKERAKWQFKTLDTDENKTLSYREYKRK